MKCLCKYAPAVLKDVLELEHGALRHSHNGRLFDTDEHGTKNKNQERSVFIRAVLGAGQASLFISRPASYRPCHYAAVEEAVAQRGTTQKIPQLLRCGIFD